MKAKHTKRRLALLSLTCMTALVFTGCASNNNNGGNTADNANTPPAATNDGSKAANEGTANEGNKEPAADTSPVTFTISTSDNKLNWDNPVSQKLTEKTGATLKYDLIVGDEKQKWDIWLAGGDYPDIMPLDPEHVKKYKDAGAIIPLNDLIEKYGPHIKEKYGDMYNLLKSDDGNIDSISSVLLNKEASPDAVPNFIVQYDVLKEAGYPTIKTLDQLYGIIADYVQKHPKIDGKDTIGYTAAMADWIMDAQFNNPITFAAGQPDHGNFRIDGDGKVSYNPLTDDAKTYDKFLNKMYSNGLLDKETFSLNMDGMRAKMAQGRVLAAFAPAWILGDTEKSLRAAGKPERAYAHIPIYFNESIVDHNNTITPIGTGTGQWVITKNAKNPERIIQFIDYLFSDEGQILTHWGIEGKDYTVVDGKRVENPEKIKNTASDPDYMYKTGLKGPSSGPAGEWFSLGNGAKLGDGDYATPTTKDSVVTGYDDMTKEVLAKYGKTVWADFLPPVEKVPGYLWQLTPPESTKVQQQKISDDWRKGIPKLIMSKGDAEFDKNWDNMKNAITKDGLVEYEGAFTQLWADFNAKYQAQLGSN
ncbi:extracellular solute-binding protein [Paenibacillus sacheonensis]|uniref:Extracellular solute-binding protein n=1 Tax=Paenibacillus sacheonensis TaxID=742054 RepID=A0A7X4YKJ9_9BACL|nr:extracellular solute-binding protein [Paenibacillus sacheonensis]MBM7563437.1 putative aldouronate transport system substrate-binding protein [Paenibacillus sacheonensis]NBC68008.1 extracellular solute-binding protein [Paenibacillus sacheonensis]